MKEIVVDKLPNILTQAEEFPHRAEEVKEYSKAEFENLNPINKAKAIAAFAYNAKQLLKLPPYLKESLENFKSQYEELKEVIQDLKENQHKLKHDGGECFEKKLKDPVECYHLVHGEIKYNLKERQAWEAYRYERRRHKGGHFDPNQYPLTNLIEAAK